MGQIGAIQIADSQFAEDIVQDRRRVLDRVVALNLTRRFEPGEGEGVDEFFQRHAVLQTNRNRDGEVVHHRPEASAFLVHVDEDFAKRVVFVFAGPQVHFVTAHDGLLSIAATTFGHFVPTTVGDFLDDDFLDHLLGQNSGLFLWCTAFQRLGGLVIILDQSSGQRLR